MKTPIHTELSAFIRCKTAALLLGLCMASSNGLAKNHNLQQLQKDTKQFVLSQLPRTENSDIQISLSKIDKRTKLAACPQALQFNKRSNHSSYKMRVEVRCEAKKSWKINLTANIHVFEEVVILKVRKFRNDVIELDDLDMAVKDVSQFQQSYFHHMDALIGYRLKTSINKGMVISPSQVIRPWLIKKDQPITISAKSTVLHIRMAGRSLMNARAGDWIRAKNINSGKIVEGTLNSHGELLVGF